ncbi:MAG: hypothetical protein HYX68_09355 [Planctomycetes bacterium]|nr:hypothetical protein [Planctomycetota bacterium]
MFKELLSNADRIDPGQLQTNARMRFPAVIRASHLREKKPNDPIPTTSESKFVIIGIASYAPDEMALLDRLENAHAVWEQDWEVAVFDVMEWKSSADACKFVTQIPAATQTPILEMWIDGKVVDTKTGLRLVQESLQKFGILS